MWNLDDLSDFWRIARREVRGPLKRIGDVLPGGLLLGTFGFAWILASYSQSQEIFRGLLEGDGAPAEAIWWLISIFFVSGLLFFAYQSFLASVRGRLWNVLGGEEYNRPIIRLFANAGVTLLASAPWVASIVSIYLMHRSLAPARTALTSQLKEAGRLEEGRAALELLERIEGRAYGVIALLAVLGVLALAFFWYWHRLQYRRRWANYVPQLFFGLAFADLAVLGIYPAWSGLSFSGFYEALGPVAASMLTMAGLFSIGLAVVWGARVTGLATYFGLLILLLIPLLPSLYTGFRGVQQSASVKVEPGKDQPPFETAVDAWIEARRPKQEVDGKPVPPIPLIVVSAQGGGMYAAAVSGLFMSRLQDIRSGQQPEAPGFNSYVFAVSGVSGGSLGTGFYDAAANRAVCRLSADNTSAPNSGARIENEVSRLVQKPHLAPIIGNVTSDVVRSLTPWAEFNIDRAEAFKQNLLKICPSLAARYDGHWTPASRTPAMVLNTTWMSNGHRVAFAPFSLMKAGDGTLWSFGDVYGTTPPLLHGAPFNPSLADALVASARFPGALPPLSLTHKSNRHSFGDGGYADASGVSTAYDMYNTIKKQTEAGGKAVPHLLMLTFDYDKAGADTENSTAFVETLEPLDAVLGVRNNLASQAITRAEKTIPADRLWRVSVAPEKFGIALGLQLSRTSFEILSLLVGRAEWCTDPSYTGDNPILRNSCVARKVAAAISAAP
jgi:hypothetical protein